MSRTIYGHGRGNDVVTCLPREVWGVGGGRGAGGGVGESGGWSSGREFIYEMEAEAVVVAARADRVLFTARLLWR